MPDNFNTLEEAQAEIIRLNEELTRVTNERDAHKRTSADLTTDNDRLRKLNQDYFNKLSAQYSPTPKDPEPETAPPTCEEFAKNLII